MTHFDQIDRAIYDGTVQISAASIKRGLKDMGLSLPLMIVAAKPLEKKGIVRGARRQKYFWHLHEGLIYILWHESEPTDAKYTKQGWLCGEPEFCAHPEDFILQLQNAILSFRRAELKRMIHYQPLSLSFAGELDTRRLALGRIQEFLSGKSTFEESFWKNPLEVWLEIILLRHQEHLNSLHRKMDEILGLMTCGLDNDYGVANCFTRLQRELYQIHSLTELRNRFPRMAAELLHEFPLSATWEKQDLSSLTQQALQWIDTHYRTPVSATQCAASIPVNPAYLCRLLRKETGLSPVQHLQQKRVSHAKVLLQESRTSIAEIAHCCGFGSTKHFYRVFRKCTDLTPAAYRRNVRRY